MQVVNDHNDHGYTVDDNGNRWFWKLTDNGVEFRRNAGYPSGHPIKQSGKIPLSVKKQTERQTNPLK